MRYNPDGHEEILDFELAQGESTNAWSKFCQNIYNRGLKNTKLNKRKILDDASWLYEAQSEEEFYRWVIKFRDKYKLYKNHVAFKYFFGKIYQSIRYFELPKEYWTIAKTTNRLERYFEELKRRIKPFRRFPNTQSCKRWLYALITEHNPANTRKATSKKQQSS